MKIFKKTINIVLTIAIFVFLPAVVFTLVTSKTNAILGIQSFVVLSGSMQPTITVGGIVYTQMQASYQKGDIVAFKSGDVNVTHRIVDVENDGSFVTRGDANNASDSKTVAVNDILGKELVFLSYIGRLIIFLKTPQGFFPLIIFPTTVFIVLELWNLKKEIEKQVEKHIEAKVMRKMETSSS